MSEDKMQDVFPIEFDFEAGEMPDGVKFTGWRKHTDAAFARITRAIGDPWEYNTHVGDLSARLAQASLARMIGPSDYLSPHGSSWNEGITSSVMATLEANRNQWRLGFPLKKAITSTEISPSVSGGHSTVLENLDPSTDIIITGPTGEFASGNLKSNIEDVVDSLDWHIDFDRGVITTYNIITAGVYLMFSSLNMLGAGTPWGTANVIPSWNQTATICNCVYVSPGVYTINLPLVTEGVRSTGGTTGPNASWNTTTPGETAAHRLPYSITSTFSATEEIPEGFMYLWEESTNRIMTLVTFKYLDEYSITAETPVDWLTAGENYRLIITGTSLAENVNYLMSVVRDNTHAGLSDGQDGKTVAFTNPISHDSLTDLYGGDMSLSTDLYKFATSNYPTNPHPQYLHRAGYMSSDETGNSGNAMRGNLVFTEASTYALGTTIDTDSCAIRFGGENTTVPSISFQGGPSSATNILPFGINNVGIIENNAPDVYGALTITSYKQMPLYLKSATNSNSFNSGASIAFDYQDAREMNYIKLFPGVRNTVVPARDVPNLPANLGELGYAAGLDITPSLTNGLSYEQVREWRFRGVSYLSSATNTGITSGGDYDNFFTSPGMVGADFINVYSNGIFFSETGDGKKTSFTTEGDNWLNNPAGTAAPIGIYYHPGSSGSFEFVTSNTSSRATALTLSYYGTSELTSSNLNLATTGTSATSISIGAILGGVSIAAGVNNASAIKLNALAGGIDIDASSDVTVDADGITLTASGGNAILDAKTLIQIGSSSTTPIIDFILSDSISDNWGADNVKSATSGVYQTGHIKYVAAGSGALSGYKVLVLV